MDIVYDDFEDGLKDLLSWLQKAVIEFDREQTKLYQRGMPPSLRSPSVDNARQAILNHCRAYDKKRKQQYGIL